MEPTLSTPVHPGLLDEIPGIKLASNLDKNSQDPESVEQAIKAFEPVTTDIMSNFVERASIARENANLAQNTGVADIKTGGVKNVQNYDLVVKDVDYDSEN